MYKESDKDYNDRSFNYITPQDLSPDRNILAYNPYVTNQPQLKPFTQQLPQSQKQNLTVQKRTSSPQPRHYTPTVIHYQRQNTLPEAEPTKRIEKVWVQNENLSNEEKEKVMSSLKEYFDRILKGLTEQMNFELRRRDEEIKKLEKRLKDNENDIVGKEREIARLKECEVEMVTNNLNKLAQEKSEKISLKGKPVEELQRNFQYLTGRIRDIDAKVKLIIQSFAQSSKQAKILTKMEEKVNGFMENFLKIETKKVYGLNLRMFEFFSSKDSLLVALERQVQVTKQTLIAENSPSKVNMTVYEQKLIVMKRQLQGLQKTVQYIGDRQTKTQFDPVKLEKLEREIARLQEKSNGGEGIKWETIEEFEKQYKIVLSRINKVYGELHSKKNQGESGYQRAAGHLKTTPKKQLKYDRPEKEKEKEKHSRQQLYQIKPAIQKKISAPPASSSSALYFSVHDSSSDVEHFNQSDDEYSSKGKMSQKLLRLIEIIRTNRKVMPLKVVVDQTGYLKQRETGAYLFDRNGVLFELEDDELDDAIRRKIVKI